MVSGRQSISSGEKDLSLSSQPASAAMCGLSSKGGLRLVHGVAQLHSGPSPAIARAGTDKNGKKLEKNPNKYTFKAAHLSKWLVERVKSKQNLENVFRVERVGVSCLDQR